MPWLGFRKQQLTEELKLCDKVGHNVNLSLICVALQKGRGTTEERAVQRECRQPENSSLGVWDTFPVFSQSNSIWRGQQEQQSLDFSIYQDSAGSFLWDLLWNQLHTKNSVLFIGAVAPWQEALGLFIVYLFTGSSRSKLLLKESRPSELREI